MSSSTFCEIDVTPECILRCSRRESKRVEESSVATIASQSPMNVFPQSRLSHTLEKSESKPMTGRKGENKHRIACGHFLANFQKPASIRQIELCNMP